MNQGVMKAYSIDLRERVIEAVKGQEESQPEVARRFCVSLSFVEKLWKQFRDTGNVEIKPHGGGRKRVLAGERVWLVQEIRSQPDASLEELCERVAEIHGVKASLSMMCRELERLGLGLKKSPCMPLSERLPGFRRCVRSFRSR